MKIHCPHCATELTIPDSEAGKTIACTQCQGDVVVPMLLSAPPLTPTIIPPTAYDTVPPVTPPPVTPPNVVPPVTPPPLMPDVPVLRIEPTKDPLPPGYREFRMLRLPVDAIPWIPSVLLVLVVLLSFTRWCGLFPAGYGSYTQNAWQATFGYIGKNAVSEKEMKLFAPLNERVTGNWLLLAYLLSLLLATAVAVGVRVLEHLGTVPPVLVGVWPHRLTILSVLTGVGLVVLMFQLQLGLGMEKAVTGMVSAKHADALALAETDEEIQVVQIRIAQEQGGYYLSRTLWLRLVVAFQWLALGAIGVQLLLQRRGEKPPPGVALLW